MSNKIDLELLRENSTLRKYLFEMIGAYADIRWAEVPKLFQEFIVFKTEDKTGLMDILEISLFVPDATVVQEKMQMGYPLGHLFEGELRRQFQYYDEEKIVDCTLWVPKIPAGEVDFPCFIESGDGVIIMAQRRTNESMRLEQDKKRLTAIFDSPETQKELAKVAKLIIKQNMKSGGKGHANH